DLPSKLVFANVPSDVKQNTSITIIVIVQDGAGRVMTDKSVPVRIAVIADPKASRQCRDRNSLPAIAGQTTVASSNGTATFNGLTISGGMIDCTFQFEAKVPNSKIRTTSTFHYSK